MLKFKDFGYFKYQNLRILIFIEIILLPSSHSKFYEKSGLFWISTIFKDFQNCNGFHACLWYAIYLLVCHELITILWCVNLSICGKVTVM